ncbi:MAG: flavodoxin [Pseudomonadota bacterium]|nr:flavodoxin [Pseudomonadota bacterium]
MSEILVINYSNTGTSRRLAQLLCRQQGWPMAEISEVEPRRGLPGRVRCLLDSGLRRHPLICYTGPPPNEYDAVVLVAPVWSSRLAGPVRSFVKLMCEHLPDLALISVTQSWGAQEVIAELSSLMGCFPVLSTSFTPQEVNDGSCAARLQAFGKAIRTAEHSQILIRPYAGAPRTSARKTPVAIKPVTSFFSSQTGK